jgi:hypothetical protein
MENDIILRTFADWLRGVIDPAGQVGHSDGQALPPSLGLQCGDGEMKGEKHGENIWKIWENPENQEKTVKNIGKSMKFACK